MAGARSLRHVAKRIVAHSGLDEDAATAVLQEILDSPGEMLGRKARRGLRSEERLESLRKVPVFAGLPARRLKEVARLVDEVAFSSGTVLFEGGEPGSSMFVVVDGEAVVKRRGRVVARLGPGEVVGEMSVIDGAPRSATVEASGALSALVMEKRDFDYLIEQMPGLALSIMETLSQRLREADRKLYG